MEELWGEKPGRQRLCFSIESDSESEGEKGKETCRVTAGHPCDGRAGGLAQHWAESPAGAEEQESKASFWLMHIHLHLGAAAD